MSTDMLVGYIVGCCFGIATTTGGFLLSMILHIRSLERAGVCDMCPPKVKK